MHESLDNTEKHPTTNTDHSLFIITLTNYFFRIDKTGKLNGTVLLAQFIERNVCVCVCVCGDVVDGGGGSSAELKNENVFDHLADAHSN